MLTVQSQHGSSAVRVDVLNARVCRGRTKLETDARETDRLCKNI